MKKAITSAVKTELDDAVAAGRMTPAQEAQLLAELPDRLDSLLRSH